MILLEDEKMRKISDYKIIYINVNDIDIFQNRRKN